MGIVEPGTGIGHDAQRHLEWDVLLAHETDQSRYRQTVHVLHGDEVIAPDLAEVVDVRDVGMSQPRGEACFVHEHGDEIIGFEHLRENALDAYLPLDALDFVFDGEEDLGHAATSDSFLQLVLAEPDASLFRLCCHSRGHPIM